MPGTVAQSGASQAKCQAVLFLVTGLKRGGGGEQGSLQGSQVGEGQQSLKVQALGLRPVDQRRAGPSGSLPAGLKAGTG